MRIEFEGDLRVVTFRQSWTDTAMLCLDRARLDRDRDRSIETEATSLGTGLHAGIEAALKGEADNPKALLDIAVAEFDSIDKVFVDDNRDTCVNHLKRWMGQIREVPEFMVAYRHPEKMVETEFTIPVASRNDGWGGEVFNGITVMRWNGTWDCLLPHAYMIDWKSAGRAYTPWERQRWAVQPTFYTEAARQMGLLPDKSEFRYVVFQKRDKPPQIVPVYRDRRFTDHMVRQLWRIVDLHDALPDGPWPINDQHALCSDKWCPYWSNCKGLSVPVDFLKESK
jgi:hypothetical protein